MSYDEDGEYHNEESGDEAHWEDTIYHEHGLASLAIVLILLGLSILFERGKEMLIETADGQFKPVVENLFGELSVLGFLSLCTFCISKSGFFERISSDDLEEEELLEMVEIIHYMLFFVIINFVINIILLIRQATEWQHRWSKFERLEHRLRGGDHLTQPEHKPKRRSILRYLFPDLAEDDLFVKYCALRKEFILDRSLHPPFTPTPIEQRLSSDFDYGHYLGNCLEKTLEEIVVIYEPTWILFGILSVIVYGYSKLLHDNKLVLAWLWIGINYVVNGFNVWFRIHLDGVVRSLVASGSESIFGSNNNNNNSAVDGVEMTTMSNTRDKEESLITEDDEGNILPHWCYIQLNDGDVRAKRNRQSKLYLFYEHGPKTYLILLQANLLFSAVYWSVSFINYFPFMYNETTLLHFIAYVTVALVPSILPMRYQWSSIAACLAQVCSIGYLRRPQVISAVVRSQKLKSMIRAFLLVQKVTKFLDETEEENVQIQQMTDTSQEGKQIQMQKRPSFRQRRRSSTLAKDSALTNQLRAAFDALDNNADGQLDESEFSDLLEQLGLPVTNEMGQKVVRAMDIDGDGVVLFDEFLLFYESISDVTADHAQSLEETADSLFEIFDSDKSGSIAPSEFAKVLYAFNLGFTLEDIGEILRQVDEDGNGLISREEFVHAIVKNMPDEIVHASTVAATETAEATAGSSSDMLSSSLRTLSLLSPTANNNNNNNNTSSSNYDESFTDLSGTDGIAPHPILRAFEQS